MNRPAANSTPVRAIRRFGPVSHPFVTGLVGTVVLGIVAPLLAQQPPSRLPHLGFAYPAGGRQGTTFTMSVGGQNLAGTTAACFVGPGITARVLGYERPLTPKETAQLREELAQLREKGLAARGGSGASATRVATPAATASPPSAAPSPPPRPVWTYADEKRLTEIRQMLDRRPLRQASPAIAETVTLEVTLAPDAAPGDRELRLRSDFGLSNPLTLQVGQLPEFGAPVATSGGRSAPDRVNDVRPEHPSDPGLAVTLPATLNGQILPGEVDRFRFAARKGQRLTIAVSARALIPYLADAVPGWFQATLTLSDSRGREVAYDDDFRFNPDPVLLCPIPEDGEYQIAIKDSIYRGREDFVYRIAIGELPFVTSVFPLGGAPAKSATFDLSGWNLPTGSLTLDTTDRSPGILAFSVDRAGQLSNSVRVAIDPQTEVREAEPNDRSDNAARVTLPCVIDGRIDRVGDEDVYAFAAGPGTAFVAEVTARRLNSPLDSLLRLTDAAGRELAANDDCEDLGAGLTTHHADSRLSVTLPSAGLYYVRIADTQHQGGVEFSYRLRLGPPLPDFELRVVPSSLNARAGTHVPLTVYALRRDGFAGAISLALRDAPPGFSLSGARIPPGQERIRLTLAVPGGARRDDPVGLVLIGTTRIGAHTVAHAAVPAEDMMQAFLYRHLVPAHALLVNVAGNGGSGRVVSPIPVRLPLGGTARLRLAAPNGWHHGPVELALSDPPAGISVQGTVFNGEIAEVTLACDATKTQPGMAGNLLLTTAPEPGGPGSAQRPPSATRRRFPSLPAIPFDVGPGSNAAGQIPARPAEP